MNVVQYILDNLKSSPSKGIIFSIHGHLDIIGNTYIDFENLDWIGSVRHDI